MLCSGWCEKARTFENAVFALRVEVVQRLDGEQIVAGHTLGEENGTLVHQIFEQRLDDTKKLH